MQIRDFLFELILFLASAVLGVVAQILPDREQKRLAASLAGLLLIVSIAWVGIDAIIQPPEVTATAEATPAKATATAESTPVKVTATAESTPIQGTPKPISIFGFQACAEPCDGSNAKQTFPQKIEQIFTTWEYANIPAGAHYVRTWSLDGREWVRYDCIWDGLSSGKEQVNPIIETRGLASGDWEMVILVDGEVQLREQITIEGKWDYWNPVGVYHTCYDR